MLENGRCGGMIFCDLLGAQFLFGGLVKDFLYKLNVIFSFAICVILIAIISEVFGLLIRIIFRGKYRSRAYFFIAFVTLFLNNFIANQGNGILPALVMCFTVTLSCDIIGRVLWGSIKTRKIKCAFVNFCFVASTVNIVLFAVFFHVDSFGESRVDFYKVKDFDIQENNEETAKLFAEELSPGTYNVETVEYGPELKEIHTDTIDLTHIVGDGGLIQKIVAVTSDYDFEKTPIAGKIYYPKEINNCPTLFMVHGMHDSAVPSYQGYDYLGEYLASYGYVVVSVDENIINSLEASNNVRAVLLLENMATLLKENQDDKSLIYHKIDSDKIAIAGHSRGGEMVATAYLFNDLDIYPDNGNITFNYHFNISSIIAIAPTVDQYMPANHAVKIEDVNYLLIHGANDQDVSHVMGEKQYNNISFTGNKSCFKASVYIVGANHGQFNEKWGRYDLTEGPNGFLNTNNFITSQEQQNIAKVYFKTFLDSTLKQESKYKNLFENNVTYLKYLPDTEYITNYKSSDSNVICMFDKSPNQKDEADIMCYGVKNWRTRVLKYGNGGDGENYCFECSWYENTKPLVRIKVPNDKKSFSRLYFRLADMREDIEKENESLYYMVTLKDAKGNQVSFEKPTLVYPSLALQLYKQDIFVGNYEYKHQPQTVMVDLTSHDIPEEFDRTCISQIEISFDGTKEGKIILDDVVVEE